MAGKGHGTGGGTEEDSAPAGPQGAARERALSDGADELAQVRHDLRTLLSDILGLGGLLLEAGLSPEQRGWARRIRNSGDVALSRVGDLFDHGPLAAGALVLDRVDFDLRRAVEDAAELLAERAQEAGLELVVDVRPEVPAAVRGDAARLRQILLNLLGDIIRAAPPGELLLRASSAQELEGVAPGEVEGGQGAGGGVARVRFEVRRESGGVDGAEPPRRMATSSARHSARSSSGVALAARLVGALGGTLGGADERGRGQTFSFVLPFERRGRSSDREAIPRFDLAGKCALVIDDSAASRRVVRGLVEELGVACGTSASGAAALSALRAAADAGQPYDIVFADAELGDVDGAALVRRIRADPVVARTRIVLLTAPGKEGQGRGDADATLAKPIRRALLRASLRAIAGASSERVHAAAHTLAAVPRPRPSQPEAARSARSRILLVDDSALHQKLAALMVEKRGYRVAVVSGGHAAIEAARQGSYAAILMDCEMPVCDGFAATAEIRRWEAAERRTPIIAMTAHVGQGARARCLAAGMDDYLAKPLIQDELDRVLRTWCAAPRSGSSGSHPAVSPELAAPISARTPAGGRDGALSAPAPGARSAARVGEPDVVAEVIELFRSEAPARVAEMRDAVGRGDLGGLAELARALQESAEKLMALNLKELCARLDREARAGTQESASAAVLAIAREVERVQASLSAEIRKRGYG